MSAAAPTELDLQALSTATSDFDELMTSVTAAPSGRRTGSLRQSKSGAGPSPRARHAGAGSAGNTSAGGASPEDKPRWPPRVAPPFLNGPVSMAWLRRAYGLGGAAVPVAIELLHERGKAKGPGALDFNQANTSKATSQSEKAIRQGVQKLVAAGLIQVVRLPGRQLSVTLLGLDDGPSAGTAPFDATPSGPWIQATVAPRPRKLQFELARAINQTLDLGASLSRVRGSDRAYRLAEVAAALLELVAFGLLEREIALLCLADACIDNGMVSSCRPSGPDARTFAEAALEAVTATGR